MRHQVLWLAGTQACDSLSAALRKQQESTPLQHGGHLGAVHMTWWLPNGTLARAAELARMAAVEQSPSLRTDGGLRNDVSWIGLDRYVPPQVPSAQP